MHNTSELDPHWLFEIAPHFYKDARQEIADRKHKMEQEMLEKVEIEKQQKAQQMLIDQEAQKVVFGSKKKSQNAFTGFAKTAFRLKEKEKRMGSVSFNEDEF